MGVPCQEKQTLLDSYAVAIEAETQALNEYTEAIKSGAGPDVWALMKERLQESQKRCRTIRKRFSDHVEEHGCGLPDW